MDFFHAHQAQHYLVLAALLFALGAAGVVLRRNAIIILMSIELMLNAVNLTFLAFARFPLVPNSPMGSFLHGHTAVFFVIALIGILNHEMWRDELHCWLIEDKG